MNADTISKYYIYNIYIYIYIYFEFYDCLWRRFALRMYCTSSVHRILRTGLSGENLTRAKAR